MFVQDVWPVQFLSDCITILTGGQNPQLRICADGEGVKEFWFSEGRTKVLRFIGEHLRTSSANIKIGRLLQLVSKLGDITCTCLARSMGWTF